MQYVGTPHRQGKERIYRERLRERENERRRIHFNRKKSGNGGIPCEEDD